MRKGLVVTLGVVALFSAVSSGFSFAPVISCIPDIIISDAEQNQTADQNFFVFSNALNLDDMVRDDDTTKSLLKWSFAESSGNTIMINGKGSLTPLTEANIKDPGAFNLRAVSNLASFRNNNWSPITGSTPYPNPPSTQANAMIQMYVSDGTSYTGQAVAVKTVDTGANAASDPNAQKDSKVPQAAKSWPFASGGENWYWFDQAAVYPAPTHQWAAGNLEMTEAPHGWPPGQLLASFGAWESPKDPTVPGAVKARFGCVLRARLRMSASVTGMNSPSLRFRAFWTRVKQDPVLGWAADFQTSDINALGEMVASTLNSGYVAGRDPGAGKTYTMLYYPQQTDTLMTTRSIVYVTCDIVDDDFPNTDAGTIRIEQVDVDGFARPSIGAPGMTSVPAMTYTDFTAWAPERFAKQLNAISTTATLTLSAGASGITISCGAGTTLWEAGYMQPFASQMPLVESRYYRSLFRLSSTGTPSGDAVPTVRTGMISSRFVFTMQKQLEGGGTYSLLPSGGTDYEMWTAAPSGIPPTSQTEPMRLRFEAYQLFQPDARGKNVSGSVSCRSVTTEWMQALP